VGIDSWISASDVGQGDESMGKLHELRLEQMTRCIPDVFDYSTMLYIGAKAKKTYPCGMQMVPDFKEAGYKIDVLEIWQPNILSLIKLNNQNNIFDRIIEGDVKEIEKAVQGRYDIISWWHGPEHIKMTETESTLEKLSGLAKIMVIVASPYGRHKQDEFRGNPHEKHLSAVYPEFYEELGDGWKWDAIGQRDVTMGNLLAWKRIPK
jgi:hypothetical protein